MDQNASNGPSKGSWREKLGLGNGKKDMPKIADEFKLANDEPKLAVKSTGTAPRAPQPVTKLAPMAPRTPAVRAPGTAKPTNVIVAKPAVGAPDSLADRLKAQRQAAEKLAEQRISLAREKAEGRANESPRNDSPRNDSPRNDAPRSIQPPAPADKPKFTFADEELAAAKRETPAAATKDYPPQMQKKIQAPPPVAGPNVTPPRLNLGGEKPIAASGLGGEARRLQPQLSSNSQSSGGYRPLDPPSFQSALKRGASVQPTSRGFTSPRQLQQSYGENGFGEPRRRDPVDDYRRRPEPHLRGEERHEGLRGESRRPPVRGRRAEYDDDMGDVFEDEPTPRRRANARDYNQAYREYEEGDQDEAPRRRSSGPLLILLAILVVAAVFVTGLWYYYFHMKPVTQAGDGQVPVIAAPEQPAKVTPEPPQEATGSEMTPATTAKKKIYDRILGEADAGGQMVPTEEAPKPVEPAPQTGNSTDADEPVTPGPAMGLNNDSGASPIPQPAGGQTSGESLAPTEEPLPLPMPPAPGNDGTQGSLTQPDTQSMAAQAANPPELPLLGEPPDPPPPTTNEAAAEANANEGAATDLQATPPSDEEPAAIAAQENEVEAPKVKTKTKTKSASGTKPIKQKTASVEDTSFGEPLVLVAPSEPPPPMTVTGAVEPSTEAVTTTTTSSGSGSLFGGGARKLTGRRAENAGSTAGSGGNAVESSQQATLPAQEQVASIDTQRATSVAEPEAPPRTTPSTTTATGTGYMAQVASLRSEAEARAELDRLRGSHGDLIGGLSTRITKATVAGSTRYRLGFGPLPSRSSAAKLCSSLIAAGERDCAVRGL